MHTEQRRVAGDGLHYLVIFPDDYDADTRYPLVVMLHGFGANMQDLAGLAPSINRKGYVYVCPNAPMPFELAPGMIGYGWHPPRGQATDEHYDQAEALLDAVFAEALAEFGAADGRAMLLGFSQGGGMTYRMGLERADKFAALIALSASLPDPEVLRSRLPDHRNQPVFVAHGLHDQMVSMDSARRTREFLDEEGYTLSYNEYNMGHEIPVEVLRDMVPWMEAIVPPRVAETDRIF
jgi:phospholipase/carboxylesterase